MTGEKRARPGLRVVKVGGSLFDLPDLGQRLKTWLAEQPSAVNVLLAGGGELADVIRRADERHHLGDSASHWLCIETLGVSAEWLAAIAGAALIRSLEALSDSGQTGTTLTVVFDPRGFLRLQEPSLAGERLPESWQVTSDSIAARLATALAADELVLLKSGTAPAYERLEDLAEVGFVDRFFPQAAGMVPRVRFENFRG